MDRHVVGLGLLIVAILLGWLFYTLGTSWFLIYVIFGGAIMMALAAVVDGKLRSRHKPEENVECKTETKHASPTGRVS